MKKISIYFIIFTLVVSLFPLNPLVTLADDVNKTEEHKNSSKEKSVELSPPDLDEKYEGEKIILFAEKSEDEIDFFISDEEDFNEADLTIPDETEAILLISKELEEEDIKESDYNFIQYTYTDEEETITLEGYVSTENIVPLDEASMYKSKRNKNEAEKENDKVDVDKEENLPLKNHELETDKEMNDSQEASELETDKENDKNSDESESKTENEENTNLDDELETDK